MTDKRHPAPRSGILNVSKLRARSLTQWDDPPAIQPFLANRMIGGRELAGRFFGDKTFRHSVVQIDHDGPLGRPEAQGVRERPIDNEVVTATPGTALGN